MSTDLPFLRTRRVMYRTFHRTPKSDGNVCKWAIVEANGFIIASISRYPAKCRGYIQHKAKEASSDMTAECEEFEKTKPINIVLFMFTPKKRSDKIRGLHVDKNKYYPCH
jgi:hypothetical protein